MISVAEALDRVFALLTPLEAETVPLRAAAGRVMSGPLSALHDQPPFPASAMDGYAVAEAAPGARLRIIGAASAGHGYDGTVAPGDAVRIFTGAPVPEGAARVVIQEDVDRDGDTIEICDDPDAGPYIRPRGADFAMGDEWFPRAALRPADIALLASMGHGTVPVTRRPDVALIATGDELVMPGDRRGPDQIVASNNFGLAAMIEAAGGRARLLPIARDTPEALSTAFDFARGADLVVTIGGASVGDHDLVGRVAADRGLERAFYKVAMRPGKPLMAGRLDGAPMIGLPGNPVSSMVCGAVFLIPALRVLLGLAPRPAPRRVLKLVAPLPANGPREHYMRASFEPDGVRPAERQDSALLGVLARADALIVRAPHAPAAANGENVEIIDI